MHASLCDFLLDIVQNAIEADSKNVSLLIEEDATSIKFVVEDDGKGMSEEVQKRVTDPFYTDGIKHVTRKVGLGIPFLIQAVQSVNGEFSLQSEKGVGTTVSYRFFTDNIDCPPVGDFASTMVVMLSFGSDYQMVINRTLNLPQGEESYQLDRLELLDLLGDFNTSGSLNLLKTYVQSQEAALDEIRKQTAKV